MTMLGLGFNVRFNASHLMMPMDRVGTNLRLTEPGLDPPENLRGITSRELSDTQCTHALGVWRAVEVSYGWPFHESSTASAMYAQHSRMSGTRKGSFWVSVGASLHPGNEYDSSLPQLRRRSLADREYKHMRMERPICSPASGEFSDESNLSRGTLT